MKYIICDDSREFALHLKERILKIEPESGVLIFNSISSLKFSIEDIAGSCDAIFFDIKLRDGSGIEAAGEIIQKYPHLKPVYVTGYGDEFSQAIFDNPSEAAPAAFLTKPVREKYLINALKKIREPKRESRFITVRQNRSTVSVPAERVLYISSDKRLLTLHTAGEAGDNISFYGKIADMLNNEIFSQIHKSYAVNLRHIGVISGRSSVTLSDGTVLPIGRSFADSFITDITRHSINAGEAEV